jgi:hypothetical protein
MLGLREEMAGLLILVSVLFVPKPFMRRSRMEKGLYSIPKDRKIWKNSASNSIDFNCGGLRIS